MKLDPRIIEGKRPLTCFDVEEARHFIGRKGYFSDNVTYFANFNDAGGIATLGMVNDSDWNYPFMATGQFSGRARYFLPKEWVKNEPEWRPYDLDSWRNDKFRIGSAVTFRIKPANEQDSKNTIVKTLIYLGHEERSNDLDNVSIYIGNYGYNFQFLFKYYEIFDDKYTKPGCPKWRPFGYQE